jgi:hypothetical protein
MGAESRLSERRQESATKFTLGDDPAKNTKLNDKNRANPVILSKTSVLSVFSVVQKMALKWLCIGFELALFFPPHQLSILTYQSIKKALTAFLQMLRLALFSQTNPISVHHQNLLYCISPVMIPPVKSDWILPTCPASLTVGSYRIQNIRSQS